MVDYAEAQDKLCDRVLHITIDDVRPAWGDRWQIVFRLLDIPFREEIELEITDDKLAEILRRA